MLGEVQQPQYIFVLFAVFVNNANIILELCSIEW
jgi:hypothetical protein